LDYGNEIPMDSYWTFDMWLVTVNAKDVVDGGTECRSFNSKLGLSF
jgi:hypothetical protein